MAKSKNRWLLVELLPCTGDAVTYAASEGLNGKHIWSALKEAVLDNFGDVGWGAIASSLNGTFLSGVGSNKSDHDDKMGSEIFFSHYKYLYSTSR